MDDTLRKFYLSPMTCFAASDMTGISLLANIQTHVMHWLGIIGVGGLGAGFIVLGLELRKKNKSWGVMFFGGVMMLLLVILSLLFGFSL